MAMTAMIIADVTLGWMPTESAAVGAGATLVYAAVFRALTWTALKNALLSTAGVTGMIMFIPISSTANCAAASCRAWVARCSEHYVYDEVGQLLAGSFMEYAMPRADNMPSIEIGHVSTRHRARYQGRLRGRHGRSGGRCLVLSQRRVAPFGGRNGANALQGRTSAAGAPWQIAVR